MSNDWLPTWNDGPAKSAIVDLLDAAKEIEPARRLAVFDNDGTLWCEKPRYTQLDFFVAELRAGVAQAPGLADRPEYRALLAGDPEALAHIGLERIALALVELFDGMTPEAFEGRVRSFIAGTTHPGGRSYANTVYQPMRELLDAVRRAGIVPFILTGGGTEFVRAVSPDLYEIPPWQVVGTTVAYRVTDEDGRLVLRRTSELLGNVNEGDTKVSNIRLHLGARPVLAAGNSAGDARMLEYVAGGDAPALAVLVDHDDGDREYAYAAEAVTFAAEPILDTARRQGWTVVSMKHDWRRMFPSPAQPAQA